MDVNDKIVDLFLEVTMSWPINPKNDRIIPYSF